MRVKTIREVTPRRVYAVTTSTGTFIADGLAHHNCMQCNVFKYGEQYAYAKALDLKYGDGTAQRLHEQRSTTHKFTVSELESIIEDRKQQIEWMENANNY
jgi:hypothetical protein